MAELEPPKRQCYSAFLEDLNRLNASLVPLPDEIWNRLILEIQSFAAIFRPEDEDELAA